MARITRKNQKIFAGNASNNGVFGSLQSDDPVTSNDPDTIQGRSAFENGWNDATYSAELLPPLEEFQGLQYLFSRQIAYLFQEGIAEWNTSTTYYKGSIVKTISGTRIYIYLSIADNNTGNLVSDTTKWKLLYDSEFGYADINLSNLTSVGKNFGNWSTNVTNCITEIPQDIKLELNSGTLTLKAGSKVYVPNGAGVFNTVTISSDISVSSWGGGSTDIMVLVVNGNSISGESLENIHSGSTQPTVTNATAFWYDTTNNVIKRTADAGSTWAQWNASLPICVFTRSSGTITGIKQVFNGFGYVGSTVFCLPNVKGIYPDGRNADGTLKGGTYTISSVLTVNMPSGTGTQKIRLHAGYLGASGLEYDSENNYNYIGTNVPANRRSDTIAGTVSYEDAKITSLNIREAFHATDYYDLEQVDSNAVHKTGTETVAGVKTFTDNPVVSTGGYTELYLKKTNMTKGTAPSSGQWQDVCFQDGNGNTMGRLRQQYYANKDNRLEFYIYKANSSSDTETSTIQLVYPASGSPYVTVPTPAATNAASDDKVATTGWVNDPSKSTNVVHRSADETINGTKTFTGNVNLNLPGTSGGFIERDTGLANGSTTPSANRERFYREIANDGSIIGQVQFTQNTNGEYSTGLLARRNVSGTNKNATMGVTVDASGNIFSFAPTPSSATDNSTKIATTAWVNNAKGMISGWGQPDYTAGTTISHNTDYQVTKDGIIVSSGNTNRSNASKAYLNDSNILTGYSDPSVYTPCFFVFPVGKNDTVKIHFTGGNYGIVFYPLKGA